MKENFRFNPAGIASLETGRHSDPVVPGLYVTVSPTGRKVSLFRRRVPQSDRTVELTCGAFPTKSIGVAKCWAVSLNEVIERGIDPREEARAEAGLRRPKNPASSRWFQGGKFWKSRSGKQASGLICENGISWTFGRGRAGPEIS